MIAAPSEPRPPELDGVDDHLIVNVVVAVAVVLIISHSDDASTRGMTVYLPLEGDLVFPNSPAYLQHVSDPTAHLQKVVKSILKAKRIAVVCGESPVDRIAHGFLWADFACFCRLGAGISVGAGIPDFRSPDGLFQTIKRENPKEAMSSGKDLFDASVFNVSVF